MPKQKYDKYQWAADRIKYFWERKRTYEATKRSFEDDKFEFNNEMDRYFDEVSDDDGKFTIDMKDTIKGVSKIICQKITQTVIHFDVKKLRKVLTKEQQKKVIQKHYQINNWPGLFTFLKESGVDWKEFLKYVDVSESAKVNVIEKMVELGEVDAETIKKCSNVKIKTQYYKITEK